MKKIILSLLIASIMLLFGCGKESVENSISQNNYNPFSNYEKESNEQVDAMFGYGLVDPAVDGKIKYNKDMSLDFWIENAGNDNDFGFMIYIDGVRQDISVDGSEISDVYTIDVPSGERKTFNVKFEPNVTKYSDTLSLDFVLMFDPDYMPDSPTAIFGNRQNINSINLTMIDVAKDIKLSGDSISVKSENIPNDIKQEYIEYDESGNISGNSLEESTFITALKSNKKLDDNTPNAVSTADDLEIRLLGGKEGSWRISLYIDNKMVPAFNGNYYADMKASSNEMSSYIVDLSEYKIEDTEFGSIYCIAVPLEEGYPIKTNSMVFIG